VKNRSSVLRVFIQCLGILLVACTVSPVLDPSLSEAIRWYTGEAGMVDDVRARTLLTEAAADGDALSVMWLARVYSTGRMTYLADKPKAIELARSVIDDVERLALAGNSEASFLMGTAYAEGLAMPLDPVIAIEWYRKAATLGNTLALHNMGNVYAAGTGVAQDDAQAVAWWLQAANKGDAIPQYRLAEMYEQGRGVEQNLEEALRWYRESAGRGNSNAEAAIERLE